MEQGMVLGTSLTTWLLFSVLEAGLGAGRLGRILIRNFLVALVTAVGFAFSSAAVGSRW